MSLTLRLGKLHICFLAERCEFIATFGYCHCLSMTPVYCDKTVQATIMQLSLRCSPIYQTFAYRGLWQNLKVFPSIGRLKLRWAGIRLCGATLLEQCEIDRMLQLITDRPQEVIYTRPVDCNRSRWLWITLNVNLLHIVKLLNTITTFSQNRCR